MTVCGFTWKIIVAGFSDVHCITLVCVALNSKNISEVQINVKVSSPVTEKKTSAEDLI